MARIPDDRHAFVIRLWLETHAAPEALWRGQVVHVPSGTGCYVQEWTEVEAFIDAYLRRTTPTLGLGSPRDIPVR